MYTIGVFPGGTQIIFDRGVQPAVWNPYPYLRIFLPQKRLIWQFFWNFRKLRPISKGFPTSKIANFTILPQFLWNGTLF